MTQFAEEEEECEPLTRRRVLLAGLLVVVAIGSASFVDGREARQRCREGVDTVASCRGVVR